MIIRSFIKSEIGVFIYKEKEFEFIKKYIIKSCIENKVGVRIYIK